MQSHRDCVGDGRDWNTGCGSRWNQSIGILRGMAMFALASAFFVASAAMAGAQTYSVLYSFADRGDGAEPLGPVTLDASTGNLFGTTSAGSKDFGCQDCGTVFELTGTGVESAIHSFTGHPHDGAYPNDVFRDATGNLFGTTAWGGAYGAYDGTVFEIDSNGVETVLHSFGHGLDGDAPSSGLIQDANTGDFYGVTGSGGAYGGGTLYKITATGSETVLYNFGGPGTVGAGPGGNLLQDGKTGNLYGTLVVGGASACGSVFMMTPAGVETPLYVFGGVRGDGCQPFPGDPGLTMDAQGNLFGTTNRGGIANQGVLFELSAGGVEKVLYKFKGKKKGDGARPYAGLVLDESTGKLYGTTAIGGAYNWGTVFELSPPVKKHGGWRETILHTFTGGADGASPFAGLVRDPQTGDLYGTAEQGGTHGYGVVFKLTP